MARNRALSDPLTLAAMPPSNETPTERERRLKEEAEAKRVSDAIDAQLKEERLQQKRQKEVKVLLLGQSESGKSTTLKQFQLMYAPNAFRDERFAWRGVIYLNLVRPFSCAYISYSLTRYLFIGPLRAQNSRCCDLRV